MSPWEVEYLCVHGHLLLNYSYCQVKCPENETYAFESITSKFNQQGSAILYLSCFVLLSELWRTSIATKPQLSL